jgi:L-ascorbate metabolism protein UlaG (beta-lactamase superfamily)
LRIRKESADCRTELDGNSIFVFETTQLCIAHLGHLHHTLTPDHLKKLGRIDMLLVPVDGGYTMQTFDMMEVLKSVNAPLMLPMHYFNRSALERFLAQARQHYPIAFSDEPFLTVSHTSLLKQPTVLVLPSQ